MRQVGDRIRLEWRAPSRNTDGTVEKLELSEVEIRRRVIDIPALVEAQTETVEPETPEEDGEEVDDPATTEPEPATPEALEPEVTTTLPDSSGTTVSETLEGVADQPADDEDAEDDEPQGPPIPVLEIPAFGPESRLATVLESTEPGALMSFEEPVDPDWLGKRVEYAVVHINRSNRRGPRSPAIQIDPVASLAPPNQPTAETGDGFVLVRWDAPAADAHYQLFRRRESAPDYPERSLTPSPLAATEFRDRTVAFGVSSCYIVRTVPAPPPPENEEQTDEDEVELEQDTETEVAEPDAPIVIVPSIPPLKNPATIESAASPEVCLVPVDTFAPPAPEGLVAVRSGEDVLLTWTDVERDDVVGYRVYRSDVEDGPFIALTADILRVPSYSDSTVEPGQTYYYAVTAIDDAPDANESERSTLSRVTFTR